MADAPEVVDINTASVKYLESLFGVGKAKAEAIHTIRMIRGKFGSLEDLLKVPGIGRNVLEMNKGIIVCKKDAVSTSKKTTASSDATTSASSNKLVSLRRSSRHSLPSLQSTDTQHNVAFSSPQPSSTTHISCQSLNDKPKKLLSLGSSQFTPSCSSTSLRGRHKQGKSSADAGESSQSSNRCYDEEMKVAEESNMEDGDSGDCSMPEYLESHSLFDNKAVNNEEDIEDESVFEPLDVPSESESGEEVDLMAEETIEDGDMVEVPPKQLLSVATLGSDTPYEDPPDANTMGCYCSSPNILEVVKPPLIIDEDPHQSKHNRKRKEGNNSNTASSSGIIGCSSRSAFNFVNYKNSTFTANVGTIFPS